MVVLKSSHLYKGVKICRLHFFCYLLDGWSWPIARKPSSGRTTRLSGSGGTTGFCCLPLCSIARVPSPSRFTVAVTLGLLGRQAWSWTGLRQLCGGTCHCPRIRLTLSCALDFLSSAVHSSAAKVLGCRTLNECLKWLGVIYLHLWTLHFIRVIIYCTYWESYWARWAVSVPGSECGIFLSCITLHLSPRACFLDHHIFFQFCTYSCVWNNEKKCTLEHLF